MSDKHQNAQNMNQDRNKGGQHAPGGNFKNDQERARDAGHKGGEHSHGSRPRENKEEQR